MKSFILVCSLIAGGVMASNASEVLDSKVILNSYKDKGVDGYLKSATRVFEYLRKSEKNAELFKKCETQADNISLALKNGADTRYLCILEALRSSQRDCLSKMDRESIERFLSRSRNINFCLFDRLEATHDRALACVTRSGSFSAHVAESCSFIKAQEELQVYLEEVKKITLNSDKSIFENSGEKMVMKCRYLVVLSSEFTDLKDFNDILHMFYTRNGKERVIEGIFSRVNKDMLLLDADQFEKLSDVTLANWNYINSISSVKGLSLSQLDSFSSIAPKYKSARDAFIAAELKSVLIIRRHTTDAKNERSKYKIMKNLCEAGLVKQAIQYALTLKKGRTPLTRLDVPKWFSELMSKRPDAICYLTSEDQAILKTMFESKYAAKRGLSIDQLQVCKSNLERSLFRERLIGGTSLNIRVAVETVIGDQGVAEIDLIKNRKAAKISHEALVNQLRALF